MAIEFTSHFCLASISCDHNIACMVRTTVRRSGMTTHPVAHRLSTLRDADGHIVETGTYNELLENGVVFTQLVRSAGGMD